MTKEQLKSIYYVDFELILQQDDRKGNHFPSSYWWTAKCPIWMVVRIVPMWSMN